MRYSVESRVPFLEPRFVELVFSLPREFIIGPDGTSKWVFRQAMRGLVPDAILDRKDKIGFTTPEATWLMRERSWVLDTVELSAALPWYEPSALRRTVERALAGREPDGHLLWRLVNLGVWMEALRRGSLAGEIGGACR